MKPLALASLLALAACQPAAEAPPAQSASAAPASAPARLPDGATLHYTRSNQDGTHPERILVHIVSGHELAVAKMMQPCTDAALVTARFDPATGEAVQLVGGRLAPEAKHDPQAWLDFDAASRSLSVRFGDPAGQPAAIIPAPPAPWRQYDFDLAEFAIFGPREDKDFAFGFALAWPEDGAPPLSVLGEVRATFLAAEGGARRFRIDGPALGAKGGEITFDAAHGYVREARLLAPNHPGYDDFLLKLDQVVQGEAEWRAELANHWEGC